MPEAPAAPNEPVNELDVASPHGGRVAATIATLTDDGGRLAV
jgi:hypothetical protein